MIGTVHAKRSFSRTLSKAEPYIFISPFYILFAIFTAYPIGAAFYLSLTKWQGAGSPQFIGLGNFVRLVGDESFQLAFTNNIWFTLASIVIVIPISLGIAVSLNLRWLRFKDLFRTIYFLPVATSTVIVAMIFLALYDKNYGTINWLIGLVGFHPVDWLGSPTFVKPAIMGLIAWRWTGLIMIYFLAGLQGIPHDLYEAAMVDGAGPWQNFLHVTLPMLRPVLLFVLVIVTLDSFRIFDEPYIMNRFSMGSEGGPEDAGLSLALYLYRMGFEYRQLGYGSAVGVAIFFVSMLLAYVQLRRLGVFQED